MDRRSLSATMLLSSALLISQGLELEPRTRCTAKSVWEGEPARVVCMFHTDVSNNEQGAGIRHSSDLNVNESIVDPTKTMKTVLDCGWVSDQNFTCEVGEGYYWDKQTGANLTLYIPVASKQHVGRYMCYLRAVNSKHMEPCLFVLKEGTNPILESNSTGQHPHNCTGSRGASEQTGPHVKNIDLLDLVISLSVALGVALTLLVVAIIIIAICYFRGNRRFARRRNTRRNTMKNKIQLDKKKSLGGVIDRLWASHTGIVDFSVERVGPKKSRVRYESV